VALKPAIRAACASSSCLASKLAARSAAARRVQRLVPRQGFEEYVRQLMYPGLDRRQTGRTEGEQPR
jgi:hypothetical protein